MAFEWRSSARPEINPRNEKEILGDGLVRARAGKEQTGEGITDAAQPQFIPTSPFPELNDIERLPALVFVNRRHLGGDANLCCLSRRMGLMTVLL